MESEIGANVSSKQTNISTPGGHDTEETWESSGLLLWVPHVSIGLILLLLVLLSFARFHSKHGHKYRKPVKGPRPAWQELGMHDFLWHIQQQQQQNAVTGVSADPQAMIHASQLYQGRVWYHDMGSSAVAAAHPNGGGGPSTSSEFGPALTLLHSPNSSVQLASEAGTTSPDSGTGSVFNSSRPELSSSNSGPTYLPGNAPDVVLPNLSSTSLTSQGPQGPKEPQGPQGPQRLQESQGLQGPQGLQGSQGLQGPQRPQQLQESQGLQGSQGPQRLQGPQESQGSQGPQGLPQSGPSSSSTPGPSPSLNPSSSPYNNSGPNSMFEMLARDSVPAASNSGAKNIDSVDKTTGVMTFTSGDPQAPRPSFIWSLGTDRVRDSSSSNNGSCSSSGLQQGSPPGSKGGVWNGPLERSRASSSEVVLRSTGPLRAITTVALSNFDGAEDKESLLKKSPL